MSYCLGMFKRFERREKPDLSLYAERLAKKAFGTIFIVFDTPQSGIKPATSSSWDEPSTTEPPLRYISNPTYPLPATLVICLKVEPVLLQMMMFPSSSPPTRFWSLPARSQIATLWPDKHIYKDIMATHRKRATCITVLCSVGDAASTLTTIYGQYISNLYSEV